MIEAVILLLVTIILSLLLLFIFYLYPFIKLMREFGGVYKTTMADYGAEGGVASAAKRGAKNFLSELVKSVLHNATGGLSELAGEAFPIVEEWLEKNPYAVIYAVSMMQRIPGVNRFIENLQSGGLAQIPQPVQNPNTGVITQHGEKEKAWWQA